MQDDPENGGGEVGARRLMQVRMQNAETLNTDQIGEFLELSACFGPCRSPFRGDVDRDSGRTPKSAC